MATGARPVGERDRPGALPSLGASVELRRVAHPRPGRRLAPRRARHHRWRPDRGAADDGDGPRRRPDGGDRAGAPAAGGDVPARGTPAPGIVVAAWRRWDAPRRCSTSTTGAAAAPRCGSGRGTARSCCCSRPAPQGLSGDELAVLLYEEDNTASTLRAELNRLRNLLGDDVLASRPYRLVGEVSGDWLGVGRRCSPATWPARCARYRGPLLPRSTSPGVIRLREEIASTLRSAVLRSGVPGPDVDVDAVVVGVGRLRDVDRAAGRHRGALAAAAAGPRPDRPAATASSPDPSGLIGLGNVAATGAATLPFRACVASSQHRHSGRHHDRLFSTRPRRARRSRSPAATATSSAARGSTR